MPRTSSIWDLHKEFTNLAGQDSLRPLNHQKDSWWLSKRLRELSINQFTAQVLAFKLDDHQYRAIWKDMAKVHSEVVSALWAAAADFQKFNCLFNQALKKMTTFLEKFATRAAPYSGLSGDHEFQVLMENFGAVVDTISIFYERFDCEGRAEILRAERDGGRMHFFGFEKNDPGRPLDPEASLRLYAARYPTEPLLETNHEAHEVCHGEQSYGCDTGSTSKHAVTENSLAYPGLDVGMPPSTLEPSSPLSSASDSHAASIWPHPNSPQRLSYGC